MTKKWKKVADLPETQLITDYSYSSNSVVVIQIGPGISRHWFSASKEESYVEVGSTGNSDDFVLPENWLTRVLAP